MRHDFAKSIDMRSSKAQLSSGINIYPTGQINTMRSCNFIVDRWAEANKSRPPPLTHTYTEVDLCVSTLFNLSVTDGQVNPWMKGPVAHPRMDPEIKGTDIGGPRCHIKSDWISVTLGSVIAG